MSKTIGQILKAERERQSISQAQVYGRMTGTDIIKETMARQYVYALEQKNINITMWSFIRWCKALGVSPGEIMKEWENGN